MKRRGIDTREAQTRAPFRATVPLEGGGFRPTPKRGGERPGAAAEEDMAA
jgi:hypothetical protein